MVVCSHTATSARESREPEPRLHRLRSWFLGPLRVLHSVDSVTYETFKADFYIINAIYAIRCRGRSVQGEYVLSRALRRISLQRWVVCRDRVVEVRPLPSGLRLWRRSVRMEFYEYRWCLVMAGMSDAKCARRRCKWGSPSDCKRVCKAQLHLLMVSGSLNILPVISEASCRIPDHGDVACAGCTTCN